MFKAISCWCSRKRVAVSSHANSLIEALRKHVAVATLVTDTVTETVTTTASTAASAVKKAVTVVAKTVTKTATSSAKYVAKKSIAAKDGGARLIAKGFFAMPTWMQDGISSVYGITVVSVTTIVGAMLWLADYVIGVLVAEVAIVGLAFASIITAPYWCMDTRTIDSCTATSSQDAAEDMVREFYDALAELRVQPVIA